MDLSQRMKDEEEEFWIIQAKNATPWVIGGSLSTFIFALRSVNDPLTPEQTMCNCGYIAIHIV